MCILNEGVNIACDICEAGEYKATSTGCDNCETGKFKANEGVNLACDNSTRAPACCSAAGHALVAPLLAGLKA
jgi:hypothetical protein